MNKKSQENSNAVNTIGTILNEENIQSLLEALNIGTSRNIYIIKEISHNPINRSILIEIPNESCVGEIEIMLNFKQGQPTVDQVYNAIYQLGADCQKQVIAFTGGNCWDDKYNPSADMDIVKCLIDNMNQFALNIYLVKLVSDSTSSICDFEILPNPIVHLYSERKNAHPLKNSQKPNFGKCISGDITTLSRQPLLSLVSILIVNSANAIL